LWFLSQWKELEHLHDQLETFYEATLLTEGRNATLADHFQTLERLISSHWVKTNHSTPFNFGTTGIRLKRAWP